jgi:hypothetical protein
MMNAATTVVVRGPAKQAEPFGFALIFWLYLLHQGKRWKNKHQVNVRKEERLLQQCFARLSMTKNKVQQR